MASRTFILTLLFASLALIVAGQTCGGQCKFRFCRLIDGSVRKKGTRILMRAPNTSLSGVICRPGPRTVTQIVSTGEALVSEVKAGPGVPLSKYRPPGLSPRFKKNFFKTFPLQFVPKEQGIGRKETVGNQQEFLDNLCVIVPITSYNIRLSNGKSRTIRGTRPSDCVSFRTRNPKVLVELGWNSSDDLDLQITEADGTIVSKDNPEGSAGRLNNDNNVGACGLIPAGKEAIIYEQMTSITSGTYTATIKHFNNCGDGPTKWRLRVIVDGDVILNETGTTNLNKAAVAGTIMFDL